MASFYIPLTGLNADTTALNTIANDLSNMNTTGFKNQTVNFSDLFYDQLGSTGSGDPIQSGAGTQVANIETDFNAGTPDSTGLDTDVALQGNGFFVVAGGGQQFLTRDGNFSLNSSGQLVTSNGLDVMGYSATNGVVNTSGELSPVTIPVGGTEPPSATTTMGMTVTLDSEGNSFSAPVTLFDSLGNSYQASVDFSKTGTNQWSYSISVPDTLTANTSAAGGINTVNYNFGSSGGTLATVDTGTNMTITGLNAGGVSTTISAPGITAGESVSSYATALQGALTTAGITGTVTASATGQLSISGANITVAGSVIQDPVATNNTGTLNFNSNGNLVSPSANVSGISFAGLSDGASSLNFSWNLFNSNGTGTISQVDAASGVSSTAGTNGFAAGDYSGFSIGSDGTVTASFSNGQNLNVGQIALGNVANLQGLTANGNGDYSTTQASGASSVGVSGSAGLGTMQDGALEASNVNISQEFSDLIIAQRAFEANSKAITTFDTITQETIQMIH
ncbi:flagellar hook protein FlgE [Terracidiphilus sp.]|jgi:flagellar hook protein FlgE|uniref:flagellar hook protein FlgE n=1 Tax=Terracidiphilus sp. TaxID=1964191 RepID=UPI003C2A68AB